MPDILHLGKFFPPFAGGIENFMADLLPAQVALGDRIAALVHDHQPPGWRWWPAPEPVEGAPETPFPFQLYRAPCFGRVLYAPVSPQFPVWLNRVIAEFRPEILHLHLPNTSAFWALLLPAARRLPWVVHWHSDVVASEWDRRLALAYGLYRPFEQAVLRRAAAIIATSPPYLESSAALAPWRNKCQVIPLGLDAARLPEAGPDALAWAEQVWREGPGLRVLTVGRMTYYKGHEYLLQAVARAENIQALIVGHGELQDRLARHIETLAGRARLLGFLPADKLAALLQTCEVFCLPSLERTEAFGVVLMEAMRYGKPVVASRIPGSGVGWVAQHENTGLLVPPADAGALSGALARLAADPGLRKRLGQAGVARFLAEFDIAQVAARLAEIYRALP